MVTTAPNRALPPPEAGAAFLVSEWGVALDAAAGPVGDDVSKVASVSGDGEVDCSAGMSVSGFVAPFASTFVAVAALAAGTFLAVAAFRVVAVGFFVIPSVFHRKFAR